MQSKIDKQNSALSEHKIFDTIYYWAEKLIIILTFQSVSI